jgi:arylsulfatase A-like enzyme
MIESLDENVGRLLSALERQGISETTMIIFTSDNGGLSTAEGSPTTNSPLSEGKGWMYEGGTREPLIIKWPGSTLPGTLCHAPVTSPDLYPTLLEIAGLPLFPEQHCDGNSLVPLLLEVGQLDPKPIFWHYPHYGNQGGTPGSSVRMGDYKLIEFFEDNHLELYNLREDLGEKNLAKMSLSTPEMHRCWKVEEKVKAKSTARFGFDRLSGCGIIAH